MAAIMRTLLLALTLSGLTGANAHAMKAKPVPFVMQMTAGDSDAQRRAFLQIAKVLEDIGPEKVKIEVVAYEGGIHALLANNQDTTTLLASLARQGVTFKACRISMRGHRLKDEDFPIEVDFVSAGAPEMVRLQMKGYRYWRP